MLVSRFSILVLILALTSSATFAATSGNGWARKSIRTASAAQLFSGLALAGVPKGISRAHVTTYTVEKIECSAAVVPSPQASCILTSDGVRLVADATLSNQIHAVLLSNGGLFNDGMTGSSKTMAKDVVCTKNALTSKGPSCIFKVVKA